MSERLTRRGVLGALVAALLGITRLLRPAAPGPACPHPLHRPLLADRPGSDLWYGAELKLPCPGCGQVVRQRGYLPAFGYATSWPVRERAVQHSADGLVTYTVYEAGAPLADGPAELNSTAVYGFPRFPD